MSTNSRGHNERSHLIQKEDPEEEETLQSLPYAYGTPSRVLNSPTTDNATINSSPRTARVNTDLSVTSFGGVSMFGAEANPRDAQELLDNLDRATRLLRKHLEENNASDEHEHV